MYNVKTKKESDGPVAFEHNFSDDDTLRLIVEGIARKLPGVVSIEYIGEDE